MRDNLYILLRKLLLLFLIQQGIERSSRQLNFVPKRDFKTPNTYQNVILMYIYTTCVKTLATLQQAYSTVTCANPIF